MGMELAMEPLKKDNNSEPDLDTALRDLGTAIAELWRLPQIADWLTRQINRMIGKENDRLDTPNS